MRVCQVFTLFLVLWDGRPDLTKAETYSAAEGENFTGKLLFFFTGNWKIFCKNDCNKTEDILVKTSENRQKNGRYSIEYEKYSSYPSKVYVSITNVSRSDSGRYRCGLGIWSEAVQIDKVYTEFILEVTKVSFRPTVPPSYNVTTTQQSVTSALTSSTLQELAEASDNAQIPESNCLYEEIPDKISQSSPRPVEISTVYVSASFSNTMEQTSDIYSLASEPSAQLQPEDILSNVTYSELDFTKSSDVVVHTAQTEAALSPLYSTVASAQQ